METANDRSANDDLFAVFAFRCREAMGCGETVDVELTTLDNPGWALRIRDVGPLAGGRLADLDSRRSRHDWVRIRTDAQGSMIMGGL